MKSMNQLLSLSAEKNQTAFSRLYNQTSPKLYSVALQFMGRQSLAEEVLQETYIKIWDKAGCYDSSKGKVLTWMSEITRNTAMDTKRTFLCRPVEVESTYEGEDFIASDINMSLENQADFEAGIEKFDRSLHELNPEQRKCIIYSLFYGYSHREISEMMGKPLGTIKSWIRRGSNQLNIH